jgi:hypothetical protein
MAVHSFHTEYYGQFYLVLWWLQKTTSNFRRRVIAVKWVPHQCSNVTYFILTRKSQESLSRDACEWKIGSWPNTKEFPSSTYTIEVQKKCEFTILTDPSATVKNVQSDTFFRMDNTSSLFLSEPHLLLGIANKIIRWKITRDRAGTRPNSLIHSRGVP